MRLALKGKKSEKEGRRTSALSRATVSNDLNTFEARREVRNQATKVATNKLGNASSATKMATNLRIRTLNNKSVT